MVVDSPSRTSVQPLEAQSTLRQGASRVTPFGAAFFTFRHGLNLSGCFEDFVVYAAVVGDSLLIPWVLLARIAHESRSLIRVVIGVAALRRQLCQSGRHMLVSRVGCNADDAVSPEPVDCHVGIPAIGVLAYTADYGGRQQNLESKNADPVLVAAPCILSPPVVASFSGVLPQPPDR